jgi:hypothetical protein
MNLKKARTALRWKRSDSDAAEANNRSLTLAAG